MSWKRHHRSYPQCHFITTENVLKLTHFILYERPFKPPVLTMTFIKTRHTLKIIISQIIKALCENEGAASPALRFKLKHLRNCAKRFVATLPKEEQQALKEAFTKNAFIEKQTKRPHIPSQDYHLKRKQFL